MKNKALFAVITAVTILLSGCSILNAPNPVPSPTEEITFPTGSTEDWDYGVTLDDFTEAFPELDTSELVAIPNVTPMSNTQMWALGNGAEGFDSVLAWASQYADMQPTDRENIWEGIYTGDNRSVQFVIRMVDVEDASPLDNGFLLYVTGSI